MKEICFGFTLILFLVAFSGCATTDSNYQSLELQDRMDKLETRLQKIETGQTQLENMIVNQVSVQTQKRTPIIEKVVIADPSNKDIQAALKNAGFYTGSIDGKIGPKTRDAIMEFQKKNGLKVDGVVGRNTWEVLNEYF